MAAAEYFASGARPSASHLSPPQPQRASSNPNMSFGPVPPQFSHTPPFPSPQPQPQPNMPQYHPPPPYASPVYGDEKPNVHFAPPPPAELSGRHSGSFSSQRPNPQQWNQPYPQPPASNPNALHPDAARYNPQAYTYQNQHPPHPAPHVRPYSGHDRSEASLMSGYSSDPEPHRRRHKHSDASKRRKSDSRSKNTDGLIGAAGGGLIGDLIFPGLGTAAGALAGWFGGRDYGSHRKEREEKRERAQEKWEHKYASRDHSRGSDEHRRSPDHSSDGRRRSHDRRSVDY